MDSRGGADLRAEGWATQYALLLGIQPTTERILFSKVVAALQRGLPQGWSHQVDNESRCYFWNSLTGDSDWFHPDHSIYTAVIDLHRRSLNEPDPESLLQEAIREKEAELSVAFEHWSGPYYTEDGAAYWHDTRNGVSVWIDPRIEVARCHALRSDLLRSLANEMSKKAQAVKCIQRFMRGWLTRKRFGQRHMSPSSPASPLPDGNVEEAAIAKGRFWPNGFSNDFGSPTPSAREKASSQKRKPKPSPEQQRASACAIQRAFRKSLSRRQLKRRVTIAAKCSQRQRQKKVDAAIDIQSAWRGYLARQKLRKMASDARKKRKQERKARRTKAATSIQRHWRGVMARRVFQNLQKQRAQETRRTAEERRERAEERDRERAVSRAQARPVQTNSELIRVSKAEAALLRRQRAASLIQAWWRKALKQRTKFMDPIAAQVSKSPFIDLDLTLQSLSDTWVGRRMPQSENEALDSKKVANTSSERWRAWEQLAQNKSPTSAATRPDTRTRRRRERTAAEGESVQRCSTAIGRESESSLRLPATGSLLRDARPSNIYTFDSLDASLFGMDALSPGHRRGQRAKLTPISASDFSTPSPDRSRPSPDRSSLRSAGGWTPSLHVSHRVGCAAEPLNSGLHGSHSSPTLRHGLLRPETSSCATLSGPYSGPTRHEAPARPISRAAAVEIVGMTERVTTAGPRPRAKRTRLHTAVEKPSGRDSSSGLPGDDSQPFDVDALGPGLGRWEFNNWLT